MPGGIDRRPKRQIVGDIITDELDITPHPATDILDPASFRLRVLPYGRAGTGKSTLAATLPRPILWVDLSGGTLSVAGEKKIDVVKLGVRDPLGNLRPKAWLAVEKTISTYADDSTYKSIVIDDLSALSGVALKYVLWLNGCLGMQPSQPQWGAQMNSLMELIEMLFATPKHIAIPAHQEAKQESGTGKTWMYPLVTGKLAFQITNPWDETYHCQVDTVEEGRHKGQRYRIMTVPDRIYTAKSRLKKHGLVQAVEDVTIEGIEDGIPEGVGLSEFLNRLYWKYKVEPKEGKEGRTGQ